MTSIRLGRRSVFLKSIIRVEADCNYSKFHIRGDRFPIMTSMTLKTVEKMLPGFIRISKHNLISPRYLKAWIARSGIGMAFLTTGEELPISRRRVKDCTRRFLELTDRSKVLIERR
ncbi:LytR/AlgR family response regulator transcription factor [Tellurirhabdus bombi]|uniref:LytR/AlgR family response regulator transcription factor n=1 Tax=Tellurirhabdus bombi TaxID=2907205 RepID=UPI001F35185C|nr:LytTR family DNA-binding domain-containing protein [Tellurirhabdus bombi]